MKKWQAIQKVEENKIVAVVRGETKEEAEMIAVGAQKGGIDLLEITFTVPHADKLIEELSKRYGSEAVVGAGTVLEPTTARLAILAGASFIVSPHFSLDIAKICNLYQVPYMPGCYTTTEIIEALQAGSDIIKVFPGNMASPSFIKTMNGPVPQAQLMPSGGVSQHNIKEWIQNGAAAVSAGSSLYFDNEESVRQAAAGLVEALNN